jgi:hypothetical protein
MVIEELFEVPAWQRNYRKTIEEVWPDLRDLQFDSKLGSRFWVERAAKFGVNPKRDFKSLDDFLTHKISDYNESVLNEHPPEFFIPKNIKRSELFSYTSSGSTGPKKETYWSNISLDYSARYADYVFDQYGIDKGIDWIVSGTFLFHRILEKTIKMREGMIHEESVQTRGAKEFFDKAKEMSPTEFVKTSFYEHRVQPVIEYYIKTLGRCKIGGITAPLFMLPPLIGANGFENVKTIYPSGMEIPFEQLRFWRKQLPDKKFLISYGHHQTGLAFASPEFEVPTYYPPVPLSLIYVVKEDNPFKLVDYGERGRLRLARLDYMLWVQTERDYAKRVEPSGIFKWDGFRDVKPTW